MRRINEWEQGLPGQWREGSGLRLATVSASFHASQLLMALQVAWTMTIRLGPAVTM